MSLSTKTITCKGTLRQVFICLRTRTPYPPLTHCIRVCIQYIHTGKGGGTGKTKGVGRGPTLAWPGWKQPDIPVEVDTDRLETSRSEAGVLKKFSLAGIAKLSRLKYR
jgi:hypothetical protein